ncbi:MAG: hypothetical protein NT159_20100 [Proteobacteria bacterium]|nr:hypothetical protein [Pseudomonadota bacterium]
MPDLDIFWYSYLIAVILVAISLGFSLKFVLPALRLRQASSGVIAALGKIRSERPEDIRGAIAKDAMASNRFSRVWGEYAQTLHPQRTGAGLRWRATTLAETFLTDQALVDNPLKTEYYKHLPGILTGLGIIGTFTGLIIGLGHFDVSLDPGQTQHQLRMLIHSVGHAFIVSAVAITLAMAFTFIEKSLVTVCYRQVEDIRQLIDGLFDTGADVEYLERLVSASELSTTQAREIKDAIVGELGTLFSELATKQIEAFERSGARTSSDLGQLLGASLGGPIKDMVAAVKDMNTAAATHGDSTTKMVGEVITQFSTRMQAISAAQTRETSELLGRTNEALRTTAEQFSSMAGRLHDSGREAVEAMGRQLQETVSVTQESQAVARRQMGEHAETMLRVMVDSQLQTNQLVQTLVARLENEVTAVVGSIHAETKSVAESQREQSEHMGQATRQLASEFARQHESMAALSLATNQSLERAVTRLSGATQETVAGMQAGAGLLAAAARDFADAGNGVAGALASSKAVIEEIGAASAALSTTATAARQMFAEHLQAAESFARMVQDLRDTVSLAKRDAAMSASLVDRLEAAASRLGVAQTRADEYLQGVTRVLDQAHQAFADNIERTLRESNRQFQHELSQAVGLLSGAIHDLGQTVESIADARS